VPPLARPTFIIFCKKKGGFLTTHAQVITNRQKKAAFRLPEKFGDVKKITF